MKIGYAPNEAEAERLKELVDVVYKVKVKDIVASLEKDDIFVVCSLGSMGLRTRMLFDIVKNLMADGVIFISLDDEINTSTKEGASLFNKCSIFVDMDNKIIQNKRKDGIEMARGLGVLSGRPKRLSKEQEEQIKALRASGTMSPGDICRLFKISKSIYYRIFSSIEEE